MSLLGMIPWKAISQAAPLLANIIFTARGGGNAEQERKEIDELKNKVKNLDGDISSLYKGLRILMISVVVVFVLSVSALVIGIIAISGPGY